MRRSKKTQQNLYKKDYLRQEKTVFSQGKNARIIQIDNIFKNNFGVIKSETVGWNIEIKVIRGGKMQYEVVKMSQDINYILQCFEMIEEGSHPLW